MPRDERLQFAISRVKAGHELSARDLFIDIIEDDPDNKLAWMWLIGLLDNRRDLIIACEEVLRIDPKEGRVRSRLQDLQHVDRIEKEKQGKVALSKIEALIEKGDIELALIRLREFLHENKNAEEGWILLAEHSYDFDEQVQALTRIQALDPKNAEKRENLQRMRYFRSNPLELASSYEERGEIRKAIALYEQLTLKAKGRRETEQIFRKINRLETLQYEKIAHISSALTIARLSIGLPLLFFLILIIQIGYDFHYFTLLMAAEFFLVIFGSFLVAVSAVSSENRLWKGLGNVAGRGSKGLRRLIGVLGMIIIFLPFLLLSIEALDRWGTVFEYLGMPVFFE